MSSRKLKILAAAFLSLGFLASAACGKQPQQAAAAQPAASATQAQSSDAAPAAADAPATAAESAPTAPAETVTETDDAPETPGQASPGVQPTLRLAAATNTPATEHFKEGTHYHKVVPAQPTNGAPGKVEVVEFFGYGCGHCFKFDRAGEAWRGKGKPPYVEF